MKPFSKLLDDLGNASLAAAEPGEFDGDDLVNTLLILQHVAHSIAWRRQNELDFTFEQRGLLAEEFGKNIWQSVTLFTGMDPHDVVRGENWAEVIT